MKTDHESDRPVTEMTGRELLDEGYIQEANRLFFHRLGLALAARPDGSIVVLDYRDVDTEGVFFGATKEQLQVKALPIERELMKRLPYRANKFGDRDGIEPIRDESVLG